MTTGTLAPVRVVPQDVPAGVAPAVAFAAVAPWPDLADTPEAAEHPASKLSMTTRMVAPGRRILTLGMLALFAQRVSGACQVGVSPGGDGGGMKSSDIAVSGLRKAYGDKIVLDGISFDVAAGSVFSMLGPNGAGKTTTVNVLTTLLKADAGAVRVAGHDVVTATKEVRAAIGVTGQFAAVDELLTGRENLRLMADLKRVRSGSRVIAGLLERFDLAESADKMASTYSGGMRL